MSDYVDSKLIGVQLQRLQNDVRELRSLVHANNNEARALYDVLKHEMNRSEAAMQARMDSFDQRLPISTRRSVICGRILPKSRR
jgi:hypothetical protein